MKSKVRRLIEMPQRRAATLWHALALAVVSMVACGGPEPHRSSTAAAAWHATRSCPFACVCVCPSIDSLAAWRLELRPVVPTHTQTHTMRVAAEAEARQGKLALIVAYLLLESSCGRTLI